MTKPIRKKHLKPVMSTLEDVLHQDNATRMDLGRIQDTLADHGIVLTRLERELSDKPSPIGDLVRIATLIDGVKVALERMGGNSLPSFRNDILALRDQMGEFRRELSDYRSALMRLTKWIDDDVLRPYEERVGPAPPPKKRPYNRRKKVSEADPQSPKTEDDAAPHNDQSEVESEA